MSLPGRRVQLELPLPEGLQAPGPAPAARPQRKPLRLEDIDPGLAWPVPAAPAGRPLPTVKAIAAAMADVELATIPAEHQLAGLENGPRGVIALKQHTHQPAAVLVPEGVASAIKANEGLLEQIHQLLRGGLAGAAALGLAALAGAGPAQGLRPREP